MNFSGCDFPKKWRTEVRGSLQSRRARFYRGAKIRLPLIFAPTGILLGSAFPKPCYAACAAKIFPTGEKFFLTFAPEMANR